MKTAVDTFYLTLKQNKPYRFFIRKTTKESKTFLPQLHFFQNMVAKVGEMAKVVNLFFKKSSPLIENKQWIINQ